MPVRTLTEARELAFAILREAEARREALAQAEARTRCEDCCGGYVCEALAGRCMERRP